MSFDNRRDRTRKLAVMAILLAIGVIILFFATLLPTSRLSLYALSSFLISIVIIEWGVSSGWVFYITSCLLSLAVVQVKIRLVPYIIFFGVYGIIKLYIEKLNNMVLEIILKLLYFNLCLAAAYLFLKHLFPEVMTIKFPWWMIIIALEIVFVLYDYVYTLFIQYYNNKLKTMLKI